MKRGSKVKRLSKRSVLSIIGVAVISTFGMGFLASAPEITPVHAVTPTQLNVDLNTAISSNFLGVNAVYHGFSYMPESINNGMTTNLRAIEMARLSKIHLHIARTWYGSDWAMPVWGGAYDWNSTKMVAFYNWVQDMKDRNIDVVLSLGWWFTQNVCAPDQPSTCTPAVPQDVNTYTKWISDSLYQLIVVKGFTNIKYGTLFTEPLSYQSGNLPSGYTQDSFYSYVANALVNQLNTDGRRGLIKIIGPNTTALSTTIAPLQFAVSNLNNVFDIYSSHDYSLSGYPAWNSAVQNGISAVASTGKPFWMDEYGKQDEVYRGTGDYGTYIAEANAAAMNAGAQTTLLWLYQDQQYVWPLNTLTNTDSFYNGVHEWGTQPYLPYSTQVRPSWHSFALMSRFLGGSGTQVLSTTQSSNGLDITAVKLADGNVSTMVINDSASAQPFSLGFTGTISGTLWRHLYNPNNTSQAAEIIGADKSFSASSGVQDTLGGREFAIYTTIDDGSRPEIPSTNYAIGATVTTSSSYELPPWSSSDINDGNTNTTSVSSGWSSDSNLTADHTESVHLDLGVSQSINQVNLFPRNDSGEVGQNFPIDFTISVSTDNVTWTNVAARTGFPMPGNAGQSFEFPTQAARYIKITGTSLRPNPNDAGRYRMAFAEVEVLGGGVNSALLASASATSTYPISPWGLPQIDDGSRVSQGSSYGWSSDSSLTTDHSEAVTLDLGTPTTVSRVNLSPRNDSGEVGENFPSTFEIDTSTDGTDWNTAVARTTFGLPGDATQTFEFAGRTTRYLRIQASSLQPNPNDANRYRMAFAEVEAN